MSRPLYRLVYLHHLEPIGTAFTTVGGGLPLAFKCFCKGGACVGMLPIAVLRPDNVGLLRIVDLFEVVPSAHQFVDKSGVVALVDEYFQLLFFLKYQTTDPIAR
jgi:hypothetical protein